MENPINALKKATDNWQKVTDATKAEAARIKAEREGEATSETSK